MRTTKTLNGATTEFIYDGSRLVAEVSDTYTIVFMYDALGTPIGMRYRAAYYATNVWETYWYEKNLQGDIVAVYSNTGIKLISYTYDAWGNFATTYHNGGATTPAAKNPFTYRGYYYDNDLGLYYLRTRYYDSNTGRFISPDNADLITASPTALTDKNLYAYCDNNPVMRVDEDGEFWIAGLLIGAAVGALINAATSAITQKITKGTINWVEVGVSAAAGAISGAVASTGIGAFGSALINATVDGIESVIIQSINGEEVTKEDFFVTMATSMITSVTLSALSGFKNGGGINSSKLGAIYSKSKTALKTAVSQTKRNMYLSKIAGVGDVIAREIGGMVRDSVVSIGVAWAQSGIGVWFGK